MEIDAGLSWSCLARFHDHMYFLNGFLRWMYWTDWEEDEFIDSRGRIEKAWMDGSHRQLFVTSNMLWPNGLTLDHSSSVMYWCDAYFDHIEKIYLNGSHRTVSKWVSQFFSSQTPPFHSMFISMFHCDSQTCSTFHRWCTAGKSWITHLGLRIIRITYSGRITWTPRYSVWICHLMMLH